MITFSEEEAELASCPNTPCSPPIADDVALASAAARGFAAADSNRLTSSLEREAQFINQQLRYQLRALRARSRQVTQNNPFGKRFAQMVVDNVAGPAPFRLQAKVHFANGRLDHVANRKIEAAWRGWGRKGVCELTGRWSWNAVQRTLVRMLAVDGELLLRKHRGVQYGAYGMQLQILDVDRLDDMLNKRLPGGGAIHMGVELDAVSRPVAYHLLKRKPESWLAGGYPREHERVPAEEIVHVFVPEFAEQSRGIPWMYAALLNLIHIGAFEEAAVIAARVGAAQMGVIESPDGGGALVGDGTDAQGNATINAEPGTFPKLPPGYKLSGWNPKYPDAAIEPFLKACLRGVAMGVNVAYHNLAGDMEGVNYSSARIAELDERDHWMTVQSFVAEHLHEPLYADWLQMQALSGMLPFDAARLEKYRDVQWQGRRWAWVDPLKEVKAHLAAIDGRLKSRTRVVAESGEDIEDVFDEIAAEQQLAEEKNVTLTSNAGEPAKVEPEPSDDDAGEPDDEEKA
jgi:lambda family phage portal protein